MQNKYLAMTPPMGWNSWNTFTWNINEALVCGAADALCESGLRDKGYEYIVVDDCWSLKQRDGNGRLVADPEKFPNGMKAVADYVHSKGFKFGMYSCCGTHTCAGYPGSFEHEFDDAEQFAAWGVDYLKYDNCYKPQHVDGEILYKRMSLALRNSGRDIVLSACNWGHEDVHSWIRGSGAQLFRSTGDIQDNWQSVKNLFLSQLDKTAFSGPYCHNDIDMLVVGMHGSSNNEFIGALGACTDIEYRTHFALWAIMGSPLMIGCDVRNMSEFTRSLLTNPMLLSIDQDPLCAQTFRLDALTVDFDPNKQDCCILARMLEGGDIALGFFNLSDSVKNLHCTLNDMGLGVSSGMTLEMCDCFTGEKRSPICGTVSALGLQPHACKVYRCKVVKA